MTWLWTDGLPVEVETSAQGTVPVALVWQGQRHPVVDILNRWRIDTDWWAERHWHDYFRLRTASGLLVVLVHDLVVNSWRLERLYD